MPIRLPLHAVLAAALLAAGPLVADEFAYTNDEGDEVRVEARLAGKGQGVLALELADGRLVLVPETRVTDRVEKDDPEPLSEADVEAKLKGIFVDDRLLTLIEKPYVLGLVTARAATDARTTARKRASLKKLARLYSSLQSKFLTFVRTTRVPAQPVQFPLVILVFESDDNFEQYTRMVTGDKGLVAENVAGFYDLRSNQMVFRAAELDDFRTLIHEGVHQQVYNRRIVPRFAPVPVWFNEGFATGFEGDGESIRSDPKVPSERYARAALAARNVDFEEIVQHDRAFRSNLLAGEAYGQAWALHWLLVTKHRAKYGQYVRLLAEKEPLAVDDPETRLKEFEETIGVSVEELQKEFPEAIRIAMRRTRRRGANATGGTGILPVDSFEHSLLVPHLCPSRRGFVRGTSTSGNVQAARDGFTCETMPHGRGSVDRATWHAPGLPFGPDPATHRGNGERVVRTRRVRTSAFGRGRGLCQPPVVLLATPHPSTPHPLTDGVWHGSERGPHSASATRVRFRQKRTTLPHGHLVSWKGHPR